MRLFFFLLFFFSVTNCFACEIKPYVEVPASEVKTGAPAVLKLVFCPLNYSNQEDFLKDSGKLIERLKQARPFDEFLDKISFWRLSFSQGEEEGIFVKTEGMPPLKVRNDFLNNITAEFNSAYKLVIIDALGSFSCAELSAIDKTSLIIIGRLRHKRHASFVKGFLHELGHSLGLRDECLQCAQCSSAGYPNCATTMEEAQKWWGDLAGKDKTVGFIKGCCGNENYIRPTAFSFMNDLDKAGSFGAVNENYIREIFKKM